MIKARLPDGTTLQFPDGTADAVVDAKVKEHLSGGPSLPSARQAEAASMTKLGESPPEIKTGSEIERMTGGMVTRSGATMVGAGLGGAVAAPSASLTGPVGPVAGMTLGAMAGSYLFDLAETVARQAQGKEIPKELQGMGPTETAMTEGAYEAAFSAGVPYIGPFLKRGMARLFGVATPEAARMAGAGERHGVGLGIAHVSPRKFVKGASKVVGAFPFVGTPFRKGQARVVGQLDDAAADILNTLAPASTMQEVSKGLGARASARYNAFDRVASSLYDRFYQLADNLPEGMKEVVPTDSIKAYLAELGQKTAKEKIVLEGGKKMASFGTDAVGEFLEQLSKLPDRITVEQARGLERQLNEIFDIGAKQGFDVSRLGGVKGALEVAKTNLDLRALPPEDAAKVMGAWSRANEFFHQTRKVFETAIARKFGRVDRNIFNRKVFQAGSLSEDELFGAVFRSKSPEAMNDLRQLVGPNAFKSTARQYLNDAFKASIMPAKEGSGVGAMFSGASFEKRLGLDTAEGKAALREMLKGTDLKVGDFEEFAQVAKKAGDIVIRDPSTFLTRRIILAGAATGLAGGILMGQGQMSVPASLVVAMATRYAAKKMMSATTLKSLTRVLNPSTSQAARNALVLRFAREAIDEGRDVREFTLEGTQGIQ